MHFRVPRDGEGGQLNKTVVDPPAKMQQSTRTGSGPMRLMWACSGDTILRCFDGSEGVRRSFIKIRVMGTLSWKLSAGRKGGSGRQKAEAEVIAAGATVVRR